MSLFSNFVSSLDPSPPAAVAPPVPPTLLGDGVLATLFPGITNADALTAALNVCFNTYQITTAEQIAGFLAQCGHESTSFRVMRENLNYSASRLVAVFPSHFPTLASTVGYVGHPDRIANRVYADRDGNGDESSGDGYKFSGKGYIQITGRYTYNLLATSLGKTLDDTVAYLQTIEGAATSAAWYWNAHRLNRFGDDIVGMTQVINGGQNGIDDRLARYQAALQVLT